MQIFQWKPIGAPMWRCVLNIKTTNNPRSSQFLYLENSWSFQNLKKMFLQIDAFNLVLIDVLLDVYRCLIIRLWHVKLVIWIISTGYYPVDMLECCWKFNWIQNFTPERPNELQSRLYRVEISLAIVLESKKWKLKIEFSKKRLSI